MAPLLLLALAGACSSSTENSAAPGTPTASGPETDDTVIMAVDANEARTPVWTDVEVQGCGAALPEATGQLQIDVEGVTRGYFLELPEGYDGSASYPLVFVFHGAGGTGQSMVTLSGMAQHMDAILVYPDGLGEAFLPGVPFEQTQFSVARDVPMFDALVEHFAENYCVDPSRIFATGMSIGGFWSNELACARGDVLRATAPVAGALLGNACQGRVAVMQIHGEADDTTPFGQALDTQLVWAEIGGCDLEDSAPGVAEGCLRYAGCADGHPLEWCQHEGGHVWPDWASPTIGSFFDSLDERAPGDDRETFDAAAEGTPLGFTLHVPDNFDGPPVHMSLVLYEEGQQLIAGAPLKTLKDGLNIAPIEPGVTVRYDVKVLQGTLEPGRYRLAVFLYVSQSFPIPSIGTDYIAYQDVELGAGEVNIEGVLALAPLPLLGLPD